MTPKQKAEEIMSGFIVEGYTEQSHLDDARAAIEKAINEATLSERESCAKICDGFADFKQKQADAQGNWMQDSGYSEIYGEELARLIRARSSLVITFPDKPGEPGQVLQLKWVDAYDYKNDPNYIGSPMAD